MLLISTVGDAADINPVVHFLPYMSQHLTVYISDYVRDTLLQLYKISRQRAERINDIWHNHIRKNDMGLSQVILEATEEEESHLEKHVQSNDVEF